MIFMIFLFKGENDIYDEKFNPKSLHNGSLPTKVFNIHIFEPRTYSFDQEQTLFYVDTLFIGLTFQVSIIS